MSGATVSRRTQIQLILPLFVCSGVVLLLVCFRPQPREAPVIAIAAPDVSFAREPIQPISTPCNLDPGKVQLGRVLFYDRRLSADNSISCISCHSLRTGGVDRKPVSEGVYHRHTKRNASTVFNVGMNYRQFWDGRATTLEEQARMALEVKAVMASTWPAVVTKLCHDSYYAAEFARLYPGGLDAAAIQDALATYERSLVTPNCRFDRYLRGESRVLNSTELAGYRLFKSLGCISCHQGRNVGGGMMQPFGVMQSPYRYRGETDKGEKGRSKKRGDPPGMLYKVPSLRNVALTAPYFHDGSADSLPKAIRIMSDVQLCRQLSDGEVRQIASFLGSLTGTYEGQAL